MKTPFYQVTGFLGSGKTTLLKRFIEQYAGKKKIAVIQNEFTGGRTDGTELKGTGKDFEMVEMNQGSVFCVCLLSGFLTAIRSLITEKKPDLILLEASGLSDPIAIGELLNSPRLKDLTYLAHVWCVADALHLPQLIGLNQRVKHQIRVADTAIINKTDVAPQHVEQCREIIQKENPFAEVKTASYADIDLTAVFDVEARARAGQENEEPVENPGRPKDIGSAVIRSNKTISMENLRTFVDEYHQKAFRLKGYVNLPGETLQVQSVMGRTQYISRSNYQAPTELIAIGPGVEPRAFSKRFRELAG